MCSSVAVLTSACTELKTSAGIEIELQPMGQSPGPEELSMLHEALDEWDPRPGEQEEEEQQAIELQMLSAATGGRDAGMPADGEPCHGDSNGSEAAGTASEHVVWAGEQTTTPFATLV